MTFKLKTKTFRFLDSGLVVLCSNQLKIIYVDVTLFININVEYCYVKILYYKKNSSWLKPNVLPILCVYDLHTKKLNFIFQETDEPIQQNLL